MNGNFLLYLYYLWHCLIYVNIQAEREKEQALRTEGARTRDTLRVSLADARINQVVFQLQRRNSRIRRMEHKLLNSYKRGRIDAIEMKSARVLLERARKKCMEIESDILQHTC